MKKFNIVWLFIDGVRRYYSDDDRSRLKFMDEFAKESIEFKNVVTSAPSTFMSLSAMMSGMPSYFINRNFDDFRFDKDRIQSLTNDLSNNGYNNYSFLMHPQTRETMINIFPMVSRKYWAKGLTHRNWWSNDDIFDSVQKTLNMGVDDKPSFFFIDYNCRHDFEMSDKVKKTYKMFNDFGYNEDNTIFILCSDHGYPDASKESGNPEYYTENNLTHDLILTDDNIMIPFFIKYPGCNKGLTVDKTICSIDLYQTIIDILELPKNDELIGKSLKPLMNGDDESYTVEFHRTDSRLALQTGRGTSIRNHHYKYCCYQDNIRGGGLEEFFDIINDPLEKNNLINDISYKDTIDIFKNEYLKSEDYFLNYQVKYLIDVFKNSNKKIDSYKSVIIVDFANTMFTSMLYQVLKAVCQNSNIYIWTIGNKKEDFNIDSNFIYECNEWKKNMSSSKIKEVFSISNIDLIITPLDPTNRNKNLISKVKKIKSKDKMFVDYNLSGYKQPVLASEIKRFRAAWPFLKQEPLAFLNYIYKLFTGAFRRIRRFLFK